MADPKDQAAAAPADAAAVASPAAAGNPKMIMGLLGLNVLVMIGVIVVLFLGQKKKDKEISAEQIAEGAAHSTETAKTGEKGGHGEAKEGAAPPQPDVRFFTLGDFTSNLSGPASTHYVKVNVNFQLDKEADEEELKTRKPQLRDKVISLLNSKKQADLQTSDGQNFLKEEIKTVTNGILQSGKIEGVYFSTFIVN